MREILFRGKRVDNGEWLVGDLIRDVIKGNVYIRLHWEHAITNNVPFGYLDCSTTYAVDPSTVGQWTGLVDKNGIKVYEGDILKCRKHDPYEGQEFTGKVWYRNGCFNFSVWNWIEFLNIMRGVEVIGNIHDNPDLIK